jgi:hypothetical protein
MLTKKQEKILDKTIKRGGFTFLKDLPEKIIFKLAKIQDGPNLWKDVYKYVTTK